ncbi:MAG: type II toxin-antitoxin system HicB family antitoxin [Anaerolineae bacterium]|nr:type II toxin-antitoxin system HicB family antitoxin [Anaerolineae bacterium]
MKLPYSVLLTPLYAEDGGGWLAEIPLLPGCVSDGETPDEAILMIEDAKRGWLESALELGIPIPEPQPSIESL